MNMKYSVDRIEGNIIILQNLESKEMKEIDKDILDFEVNDGDIIIYENNQYRKDDNAKEDRLKMIQEKLNRLKELH